MSAPARRLKTAVLISGRGSNMAALIEASRDADYPADIRLVISNRPGALGLDRAREAGLDALCIDHTAFANRDAFEDALHDALTTDNIELVACAGFMRVLTPCFVAKWDGRLINIHPSLLPKYKGLHTHRRAIDAGDSVAGATVHWVSDEVDGGEIIAQSAVALEPGETEQSLADRVLAAELLLYPEGLALAARHILDADSPL